MRVSAATVDPDSPGTTTVTLGVAETTTDPETTTDGTTEVTTDETTETGAFSLSFCLQGVATDGNVLTGTTDLGTTTDGTTEPPSDETTETGTTTDREVGTLRLTDESDRPLLPPGGRDRDLPPEVSPPLLVRPSRLLLPPPREVLPLLLALGTKGWDTLGCRKRGILG